MSDGAVVSLVQVAGSLIVGGGLTALVKAFLDARRDKRRDAAGEPGVRADGESKFVRTAEQVVALVEREMEKQSVLLEKNAAQMAAQAVQIGNLTKEVELLRQHVHQLEDLLRLNDIRIPSYPRYLGEP